MLNKIQNMQESESKLHESLQTLSQNVQHYAAGSDLDEFVFDFSSMPTDADSCFELNADLETHKLTCDITFYDLQTDKGAKRKHSEASDPVTSSDTSGYESDGEDEGEVKRSRRKKLRARRFRDDKIACPDISHGVKSDLHVTSATDESPASESSSEESIIDVLGLELSSDSSSEESVASDCVSYLSCDIDKYFDSDSSACSDTCSESEDSSSADSDTSSGFDDSSSDSDSSLGYFSNLTSSDYDGLDSDSDECDSDTSRIPKCPISCVCRAGPSNPPIPIERESAVSVPLLKRLLLSRLLGPVNTSPYYCCRRKCCLKWEKGFRR